MSHGTYVSVPSDRTSSHTLATSTIKMWKGDDPLAKPIPTDINTVDINQIQELKIVKKIEESIKKIEKHIGILESEEYRHRRHIRREIVFLVEAFNKKPEDFGKDKGNPFRSLRHAIKTNYGKIYNSFDIQFRSAKVEQDLGIPLGTFSYNFLKSLLFAKVYQPNQTKVLGEKSEFNKAYGSYKDSYRFNIQKEAFELACHEAGVERTTQVELKKLETKHIIKAVATTKNKYPNVFKHSRIKPTYTEIEDENKKLAKENQELNKIVRLLLFCS